LMRICRFELSWAVSRPPNLVTDEGGKQMKARITVDLPVELLEWVKKRVEEEKISRNMLIERALEAYKAEIENKKEKKDR